MPKPNNTIESLLSKTSRSDNGCWIWTGRLNAKGYGVTSWQGKAKRVHRVVFEHFNGPLPEGMRACHRCDTRACCNPEHLFAGTDLDNERDKVSKGRHRNRWTGPLRAEEKLNSGPSSWSLLGDSKLTA